MFTTREIARILRSKFKFDDVKEKDDHIYLKLELGGQVNPVVTKVSHHKGTVSKKIEGKIAKQLRVESKYFREMVGCTRSCEEYYERLRVDLPPSGTSRL